MSLQLTRKSLKYRAAALGGAGTGYQRVRIQHTQELFKAFSKIL
jgi:hypothetical protein